MTDEGALARNYRAAFLRYLPRRDEAALTTGYEIGRSSVEAGVGILDLAQVHHTILVEVLEDTDPSEIGQVAAAASEFLVEVLATFHMAQRALFEDDPG